MQWVRSIVSLGRFVVARTGAGQESRRSIENKAPDANGRWTGTSRRPTEVRTHARSGGDDTAPTTDSAFDRDQGSPAQLRASYSVRLRGHHPDQINGGTTSAGSNHGNRNDGGRGGTSGLVHLQSRRAGMQICPEPDPPLMMQEQGRRPQAWVYQPSPVSQPSRVQRRHLYSYPY